MRPTNKHDEHGRDHEVDPHAGEVQIELAAETRVHGRQRHAAPPQERVAGAAQRDREPGVARRQRRRRERDRHEVQRDERIRRAAGEIQHGREDDDVDGEVQGDFGVVHVALPRARGRSSARSRAPARRWRARARAAAAGRRARNTRPRRGDLRADRDHAQPEQQPQRAARSGGVDEREPGRVARARGYLAQRPRGHCDSAVGGRRGRGSLRQSVAGPAARDRRP